MARKQATKAKTAETPTLCTKPLAEFIPAASPQLVYPHWLEPVAEVLARAELALRGEGPPVRACISVPPQHGKTTLLQHWMARTVARYQHLRHAYCSYGAELAFPNNAAIRDLVDNMGVPLRRRAQNAWSTESGGGIVASGIPGPLTGKPVDGIGLIDDPLRGRIDAESPTVRRKVWAWYTGTFFSRIHNRTSVVLVATRWHEDDPTGRLTSGDYGDPYELINIPAIDEDGNALCPMLHSAENLAEKRAVSEYDWWSLYMGKPRNESGYVLDQATTAPLASFPQEGRVGIGVDFAYTASQAADHSSVVAMRQSGDRYYVIDRLSAQERIEVFLPKLRRFVARYPGAPVRWHGSTTEVGSAAGFNVPGLVGIPARGDKKTRGRGLATAWNDIRETNDAGEVIHHDPPRVIVPADAPWTGEYLSVMHSFTGINDPRDDDFDATVSAFSALDGQAPGGRSGRRRRFTDSLSHF